MMSRIEKRDMAVLGAARRGLARAFELSPAARAARIEAYRLQVALAGCIVEWLPRAASQDMGNRDAVHAWKHGQQYRWFATR